MLTVLSFQVVFPACASFSNLEQNPHITISSPGKENPGIGGSKACSRSHRSPLYSTTPDSLRALGSMKEAPLATKQEMMDNLVPLHVRDSCANVLIPLNK
jgi:hypothetical protein